MTAALFLRQNWKLIGIGLLMLALGIQSYRIQSWKAHSAALETRNAQQVSEYREGYNRAVALALAEKSAKEAANEKARLAAAQIHERVSIVYRDRVLRLPAADPGSAGQTDLPGNADATRFPADGAGDSVVLARADVLICAANTSYAQAAHEWAISLGQ